MMEDDMQSHGSPAFLNFRNPTEEHLGFELPSPVRCESFLSQGVLDFNQFNPKYYPLTPKTQRLDIKLRP